MTLGPKLPGTSLSIEQLPDQGLITVKTTTLSDFVRNLVGWVVNTFIGDHDFATLFKTSKRSYIGEYFEFDAERDEYNKMWEEEVRREYSVPYLLGSLVTGHVS